MTVLLKPLEGILTPDPATGKPLPAEGSRVELTTYWRRRLANREVTAPENPGLMEPEPRPAAAKTVAKAATVTPAK